MFVGVGVRVLGLRVLGFRPGISISGVELIFLNH